MITDTDKRSLMQQAIGSLRSVYDPELGLNVIDLGLIYQLYIDPQSKRIFVDMTLTTRFCPMGDSITTGVQQCLELTFPAYTVDLQLSFDPPWKPDFISEEGKEQLEQ